MYFIKIGFCSNLVLMLILSIVCCKKGLTMVMAPPPPSAYIYITLTKKKGYSFHTKIFENKCFNKPFSVSWKRDSVHTTWHICYLKRLKLNFKSSISCAF